jgi:hypothetical protein
MNAGTCRSCGAVIWWGKTPQGKAVPLDAPEKRFVLDRDGTVSLVDAYLTHFATCPNASEHRKPR